jgi:hypothetical protein
MAILADPALGQETDSIKRASIFRRNSIYATGSFFVVVGGVNVNYERTFLSANPSPKGFTSIRAGFGKFASSDAADSYSLALHYIFGNRPSHVEAFLGAVHFQWDDNNNGDTFPDVGLGYRYQSPKWRVIFRTGASYPGGLYLSLGLNF